MPSHQEIFAQHLVQHGFLHNVLRGYHSGGRLLILGNGPSVRDHDLSRINCPIIGLNQAWRLRICDYYCTGDVNQLEMYEREHGGDTSDWAPLFMPDIGRRYFAPAHAILVKAHHVNGRKRFSFDLANDGIYLNNTIASFGFQLAVYMLGTEGTIYLLGVDCHGRSFTGAETPESKFDNQRETLAYIAGVLDGARPGIRVVNLSQHSMVKVFEKAAFGEVFR